MIQEAHIGVGISGNEGVQVPIRKRISFAMPFSTPSAIILPRQARDKQRWGKQHSNKRPMMGFLVGRSLGGLRNRAVQIPGAAAACARPLELSAHLQRDHLLILQNDRVCLHAFPLRLL